MPERHRILIVDDDAQERRAVAQALRREAAESAGIEADVLEVDTVAAAREALRGEEFACVFLDHDLPDGTALDLMMGLRAQGLTTPVVVLTGRRDDQAVAEVMRAGAVDYLPKERLHPDLVARSLRAALLFRQAQREKQAVLAELRARDRAIAAASNGILIADPRQPDCPIVYANAAFLRMTGYAPSEVVGRNCRFLQGPGTDPEAVRELREAIRAERACQVAILNYRKDGATFWNEVTVSPVRDVQGRLTHFIGVQTDVTARYEADRERGRVEEALRRSREDLRLAVDAARLGTFYCDYPLDKIIWNDICKQHFFLPPDAEVDMARFYALLHPDDREATRRAIERALDERVEYDVEYRTLAPDGRTRWVNAVGRFYYGPDGAPLRFDGITIDISARKAAEEEVRRRAEREALLNRVGQALRATTDPDAIQEQAAHLLGEALGADRCFYVTYDLGRDEARIFQDWRRGDLPSLAGDYAVSDFQTLLGELFPAPRTAVVDDVRAAFSPAVASVFEDSRHRAVLVVPFFDDGELVAALYVSMADAPRAWTGEEAALVEQVATLTRTSLEAALVRQQEHRIAEQLQGALQPALPDHVPGLSVGKYTQPALDEAKVGGDFYDIFPLDKELYAVVIGDVSGKGLAAAQQLALVRNSLRTTLYLYRAPAQAAATLNGIVTAHDLLVGFVTCFVGVYDAGTGEITYCSCGHEPGLVRRAGGAVEALATNGPPLGVAEGAAYTEARIRLSAGDCLLLYTDGISEAGPSRRVLLGTEGLSRLLAALPAVGDVQAAAESLVGQVSDYAHHVFRDDVAVLLARRQ